MLHHAMHLVMLFLRIDLMNIFYLFIHQKYYFIDLFTGVKEVNFATAEYNAKTISGDSPEYLLNGELLHRQ